MNDAPQVHPSEQVLGSYGMGKLDDRSAESVHRHLESCEDCRRRVASLSADSFLGRVRGAKAPGPADRSAIGRSLIDGTISLRGAGSVAPPLAESIPRGLADHPDYEIKRELGRGGMGVVYLAHNRLMGRDEVLKVMGRHLIDRPGVLDRFLREIRAVGQLRHPNIVAAYSAARVGDSIVFAMEYVEGLDLSRIVKAKGPLPVAHAANFAHQAALGLQHASEAGLVHRDVKPANLMLSAGGGKAVVKVLDFGLAKATREQKVDSALTSEGQALGTPDYIAPEQILNAPDVDIRADIYSLGGTLFYLLTGRPPFRANSLYDLYQAHMSNDADPLNLVRPEVPSELAALVAKMMAKDPARRFQQPGEIAEALRPFFKKPAPAVPTTRNSQPSLAPPQVIACPTEPSPGPVRATVLAPAQPPVPVHVPAPRWDGIIQITSANPLLKPASQGRGNRNIRRLVSLACGLIFLGLIAAWQVGVLRIKTPHGVIVLENLPRGSEVFVDGARVTVATPSSSGSFEIQALAGERRISVQQGGSEVFWHTVHVKSGDNPPIRVSISPATDRHERPVAPTTVPERPATVPLFGRNLVVNGDAERFTLTMGKGPSGSARFEGWEQEGSPSRNTQANFPLRYQDGFEEDFGTSYFMGGNQPTCRMTQAIDLSAEAEAIDTGTVGFKLRGWLGNHPQGEVIRDEIEVTLEFLDKDGKPSATYSMLGPTEAELKAIPGLSTPLALLRNKEGQVPPGSRSARIQMLFTRRIGVASNGCVDNLSLELSRSPSASGPTRSLENSVGMKLNLIPAGEFMMGCPDDPSIKQIHAKESAIASPAHLVRITRGFYIGIHEVTQRQYEQVIGSNPSKHRDEPDLPVECVSWFEAIEFCNRLSAREQRPPYYRIDGDKVEILGGDGYRLPTEAEWEYACRAEVKPSTPMAITHN